MKHLKKYYKIHLVIVAILMLFVQIAQYRATTTPEKLTVVDQVILDLQENPDTWSADRHFLSKGKCRIWISNGADFVRFEGINKNYNIGLWEGLRVMRALRKWKRTSQKYIRETSTFRH